MTEDEKKRVILAFDFFFPGLGHLIVGRFWTGTLYMVSFIAALWGVVWYALMPLAKALRDSMEYGAPGEIDYKIWHTIGCALIAVVIWVISMAEPRMLAKYRQARTDAK